MASFVKLSCSLVDFVVVTSKSKTSLFVLHCDAIYMVALIYIDDIINTRSSLSQVDSLISSLYSQLAFKDFGVISYFLGLGVVIQDEVLWLNQHKQISELIYRCDLGYAKEYDDPIVHGKH